MPLLSALGVAQDRERLKNLKIWEKSNTAALPVHTSTRSIPLSKRSVGLRQDRIFQGRRREKENMSEFIAKKRGTACTRRHACFAAAHCTTVSFADMFLMQMSLDTKRSEIQAYAHLLSINALTLDWVA